MKKNILGEGDEPQNEQIAVMKEILENTQANIKKALDLIKQGNVDPEELLTSLQSAQAATNGVRGAALRSSSADRVIEGVFNGEKMIAADGNEFIVPVNYASKSKLVEGDILKLTITKDGSFIYKQIGPTERVQTVATLAQDDTANWYAVKDKKQWLLLTASVTYYHGNPGDEVVILIPKEGKSRWAAVENIIRQG